MRLIERYALSSGLKIGKQSMVENYYPLPFSRYITLHASSKMAGKEYPHYHLVIDLLKPYLDAADIRIVQLGAPNDAALPHCHHTQGKTDLHQASYLVHGAMLHLGNDSVWGHRAGYLGIPLVQPWGTTDPKNHSSYEADPSKTVFIQSHRFGRNPTFAAQESPSTIALIPPEDLAGAVLRLLGIPHQPFAQTQFIGPLYNHTIFDWVPNAQPVLNLAPEIPISVRMDLEFNEANLLALLQTGRKVTIVTGKPINLQVLAAFRASILSYSHELGADCPPDYILNVKRLLTNVAFFSREPDAEKLSAIRFQYFDVCTVEQVPHSTRDDYLREASAYLNKPLDKESHLDTLSIKTNKYIMSNGKIFLSYAHVAADQSVTDLNVRTAQVIDLPAFWRDLSHYLVYQPA